MIWFDSNLNYIINNLSNNYELILSTIIFTPILVLILNKICLKFNFLDFPNKRKSHSVPMPFSGGLTIGIILFLNSLYLIISNYEIIFFYINIYVFSLLFLVFGFFDDLKNFSTKNKLFLILLLLFFIVFATPNLVIYELKFYYIFNKTFVLDIFAIPFTIFCIFMLFNALNFADGKNGISIALSIYWLFYVMFKISSDVFFVIGLIAILIIVLYFNLKNKLFLGNSGVNFLSIFISLLIIKSYNTQNISFFCDEIFLLLFIPGIDAARVTIYRALKKKSPFSPDKTHLHHYLEKYINDNFIWLFYLSISIMPILILKLTQSFFISIFLSSVLYLILFNKFFAKIFKSIR